MKAMILAAGLGTRLRPLTNDRPKALVEVADRTLLEITLKRLHSFGIGDVIINLHHFADMVVDYLNLHDNFGMHIEISREEALLDTGGGLKNAAHFFLEDSSGSGEPFILHNVDVLSTIDFGRLVQFHDENEGLATLAVQDRETSRYLLFDGDGRLCGRRAGQRETGGSPIPTEGLQALAFSGIHVISPRIFSLMSEEGAFSIINTYLRLAAQGEQILAFRADKYYWRDLGRPDNVAQAERDFRDKVLS
jgi:NDP-sugar pyrophosphorylase family protein